MFSNKAIGSKKEEGVHTESDLNETPLILNQNQDSQDPKRNR